MIKNEVNAVENQEEIQQEQEGYEPRPVWQVWGARVGLVLFILFVIYQLVCVATGGL